MHEFQIWLDLFLGTKLFLQALWPNIFLILYDPHILSLWDLFPAHN